MNIERSRQPRSPRKTKRGSYNTRLRYEATTLPTAMLAGALGINPFSFGRICRRYGVETPMAQARRLQSEAFEQRHRKATDE